MADGHPPLAIDDGLADVRPPPHPHQRVGLLRHHQDVDEVPPADGGAAEDGRQPDHRQWLMADGHQPCLLISSATLTTCTISATACTRTICAPARTAAVHAAAVPQSRWSAGRRPTASRK